MTAESTSQESRFDIGRLLSLAGRTSVVTGASGDLGRASAIALAQAGSNLVLLGRNQSKLDETMREVKRLGRSAIVISADVTSQDAMERAAQKAASTYSTVDILVNAHGINRRISTQDYPLKDWEEVVDTNLKGTFISCQTFGRMMVKQMKGKIVNLTSTASASGYRWGYSAYSPSKAGVDALTRTLAVEWGRYGITVNSVAPYFVQTSLTSRFLSDPQIRSEIEREIPLGRLGRPRDIVGAILFFAAPASDWITGQTIFLDGGFSAH